jgi:rhodanese-related sulfurtransferase
MVTGIVPSAGIDVAAALRSAGLPPEPLVLVSGEDASLGDALPRPGSDILMGTTGTGTGVPGLTSSTPGALGAPRAPLPAHERLRERLGELEIPDDEIENYLDALEAGRSVVGYAAAGETAERVAAALRAAGVANVKIA